jgi:hypothetical protein
MEIVKNVFAVLGISWTLIFVIVMFYALYRERADKRKREKRRIRMNIERGNVAHKFLIQKFADEYEDYYERQTN